MFVYRASSYRATMFTLRRIRVAHPTVLRRGNASLQAVDGTGQAEPPLAPLQSSSSTKNSSVEPQPRKNESEPPAKLEEKADSRRSRGRRKLIPPRRPPISLENSRKWNRPIAKGVIPAYDLALQLLIKDSNALTAEAQEIEKEVQELEKRVAELNSSSEANEERALKRDDIEDTLEERREKLRILQVQSQVNLPDVRWKVANAMADLTQPAHRHLVEQRWRKDGDLDLLMERIHQMNVIPDVVPDIHPSIDIHVAAFTSSRDLKALSKRHTTVEPGTFLLPEQTVEPPNLYANVFHTDTRLYTMLLVDPDVPEEETQSFRTFLHWLKPNVSLTATHRARITRLNDHTPYIPPHPQKGTPYHRYVLLFLPQPPLQGHTYSRNTEARAQAGVPTSVRLDIPPMEQATRRNFDVRGFMQRWGLDKVRGGGAHMWREIWDEKVSEIYRNVLKEPEPRYGRVPKADRYAEYREQKRYV